MKHRYQIAGVALAAGALLLWLHCGGTAQTPPASPAAPEQPAKEGGTTPASTSRATGPAAGPTASAKTASTTAASSSPASSASQGAPAASATSGFAATKGQNDEHDMRLLAAVERATKQSPSAEVRELVQMAHNGASSDALKAYIQSHFRGQFDVKSAALDWVYERDPKARPAPVEPAPAASGHKRSGGFKPVPSK